MPRFLLVAIVTVSAMFPAAVGFWSPRPRPNVLLVTLDTFRADHTGVYGYKLRQTTPNLDRFSRGARVFDDVLTPVPYTAPTHFSFLTGLSVLEHGVLVNGRAPGPNLPMVAEEFRRRGYVTGAVVSTFVLDRRFGFAKGFDWYDDVFERSRKGRSPWWEGQFGAKTIDRDGAETVEHAIRWISKHRDRPWFLWVHFFDTHIPYGAPAPFGGAYVPDPANSDRDLEAVIRHYDEEVLYVDSLLARVLEVATTSDRETFEIVVSDHGEGLGQHGECCHGDRLFDQTVRLVLLVKGPGILPGRDSRSVAPSGIGKALVALARNRTWKAFDSALQSGGGSGDEAILIGRRKLPNGRDWDDTVGSVLTETSGYVGLRDASWRFVCKTIFDPTGVARLEPQSFELYDTRTDAGEDSNIAQLEPSRARDYARRLAARLSANRSVLSLKTLPFDLERWLALKSLGYLQ